MGTNADDALSKVPEVTLIFWLVKIAAKTFRPFLFWAAIVATTTFGTTLAVWYRALGSVSVDHLGSRKAEAFYWLTIMFSQTRGTALGDWMADGTGLGYEGAALVFAGALVLVAAAYYWSKLSPTLLFPPQRAERRQPAWRGSSPARAWRSFRRCSI